MEDKSNFVLHAERELNLLNKDNDEMQSLMNEQILEIINTFDKHNHSGFSANYAANIIDKLLRYELLTPLTGEDDEWNDISDMYNDGATMYQNNRCSAVFKDSKDGKAHYQSALIKRSPNGTCWSGPCWLTKEDYEKNNIDNRVGSSWVIKEFPFTPKKFYIDVLEDEVKPDDWEAYLKDKNDLRQLYEYYEGPKRYRNS